MWVLELEHPDQTLALLLTLRDPSQITKLLGLSLPICTWDDANRTYFTRYGEG